MSDFSNRVFVFRIVSLVMFTSCQIQAFLSKENQGFFSPIHKILDSEQDGFRKFRGTTHSLLRFSQSVLLGFSEQKATLATFIDMEKAFDSVWRDGLLFKLHDKGVTGTV